MAFPLLACRSVARVTGGPRMRVVSDISAHMHSGTLPNHVDIDHCLNVLSMPTLDGAARE
jgi:hypothetical protein